jgi:exo-1,4-beta-D-glucosaminidase
VSRSALFKTVSTFAALAGLAGWGASTAAANVRTLGLSGWQVQSTARADESGSVVSRPSFPTTPWLHVHPDDAGAVGTEVGALVQTGHCPNVFFSTNMKTCFGYMSTIGPDTIPRFAVPWWFRTTFSSHLGRAQHAELIINGVVGEADVWLNGELVATRSTVQGDYTRYTFDVTGLLRHGRNALALKLYPNDPNTMFTLDDVDWMQIPPDNNTGIQFPVQLHTSGPLALSDAHVVQHDAPNFSRATLKLKGVVTNYAGRRQSGTVAWSVTGQGFPAGHLRRISLAPHTSRTVSFRLVIRHPRVWWPYQMGAQPLYRLTMSVRQRGQRPDTESETFAIRTITTRLIGASPIAPHGSRQFLVNGRPFVFRGGGWAEDLFLRYSAANTAAQIAMIKNLGLNGLRTEGKQMPQNFYEQMDKAGILIDAGFQCCDAWQLQDSKLTTGHDFQVLYNSALTIGENLRNHPSVLNFSWSDDNPIPRQEAVSFKGFRQADFQDPLVASAEYNSAPPRLPSSGEKEGPYDWVPPSYWYDTTHYAPGDPTRTNVGGAWAFDSEASAGATIPTLDSIKRFMSPLEQAKLWQSPNYNQYHLNYEAGLPNIAANGGYSFGTLHDFDAALRARYGPWSSLSSYVEKAQVQDYETQRAEFEAYIDHSTRPQAPSTGIDYWQLNKGWPSLLWNLYNADFDEAGSYFGAKKANEPLHALYAYDDGSVAVDNLGPATQPDLSVESNVYAVNGTLLDHQLRSGITLASQGVATEVLHPRVPATTKPPAPAQTYFVELLLLQDGQVVDRNVYWLSTQEDLVNWRKTIGNPQATMTQFANLTELESLPAAPLTVTAHTLRQPGPDGANTTTDVTITNVSSAKTVAFFIRADIRRGSAAGVPDPGDNEVLPTLWNDNDITLWPGESETLQASYRSAALRGRAPVVSVYGWNVPGIDVSAP